MSLDERGQPAVCDADVERVARALGGAPSRAYTTPVVYPWAVQNFAPRPLAERPRPGAGRHRLYVHVPFCRYHCTFCFYAVRTGARRDEMVRYVEALARELEWVPQDAVLARLTVGGGTPTALPPDLFERLFAVVFQRMRPAPGAAHTVEASPDSLSDAHIAVLRQYGIGRVSLGIESLDDAVLGTVQRRHTPEQALAACRRVTDGGLSLNVDFIYGLPGQTEDSVRRDLEAIAATGATTLCLYGLRLNERTVVAAQLDASERLDLARVMRWRAFVKRAVGDAGFVQTRSYTFRRASSAPAWHEQPASIPSDDAASQLGVGMSARAQIGRVAYRNHDRNDVYMDRVEGGFSPVESVFELDDDDLRTQVVASVLANGRPLDRRVYADAVGTSIDADFEPLLDRLCSADLLDDDGERLVLTEMGRLVYDRVLLSFYSERARDLLKRRPPIRERRRPAPHPGV